LIFLLFSNQKNKSNRKSYGSSDAFSKWPDVDPAVTAHALDMNPGSWFGAATLRWFLQQLHSKTVLAHISPFPNKCTIKHPWLQEKSGIL
jgi:hypothetical protein